MAINLGLEDALSLEFWRKAAAEFLACVIFLVCVICVTFSWDNINKDDTSSRNVEIGLGIGFTIATLAYAFGHISGGHVNPAVSLGMVTGGRIPIFQGLVYIIAQLVGAIMGSAITYTCMPVHGELHEENNANVTARHAVTVTMLHKDVTPAQGFGLELIFTFLLVFFIFSVTDPVKETRPSVAALGIGVAIVACHACLIPFTGCCINPARTLGPAIITNTWKDHWVYWVGPLLGGVLASVTYNFVFFLQEEDETEDEELFGMRISRRGEQSPSET